MLKSKLFVQVFIFSSVMISCFALSVRSFDISSSEFKDGIEVSEALFYICSNIDNIDDKYLDIDKETLVTICKNEGVGKRGKRLSQIHPSFVFTELLRDKLMKNNRKFKTNQ